METYRSEEYEQLVIIIIIIIVIIIMIGMACRQNPTMAKCHPGRKMSVMNMVGFCQRHIPTIVNINH